MVGFSPWMVALAGLAAAALFGLVVAARADSDVVYVLGLLQCAAACVLVFRLIGRIVDHRAAGYGLPWPATQRGNGLAIIVFAAMAMAGAVLAALTDAYWQGLALAAVSVVAVFRAIGAYFDAGTAAAGTAPRQDPHG